MMADLPRSFRTGKWWAMGVAAGFLAAGFLYLNFARADDVDRLVKEIGAVRDISESALSKASIVATEHANEKEQIQEMKQDVKEVKTDVKELYKFMTGHEPKKGK